MPISLSISYGMMGIALALLIIYGADVMVGGGSGGDGFLPFDSMVRGVAFGTPPIILSFVAFVISRKDRSSPLGGMMIATGILIIVGGSISMAGAAENTARAVGEGGALLGVGAAIILLGGLKIRKSLSR